LARRFAEEPIGLGDKGAIRVWIAVREPPHRRRRADSPTSSPAPPNHLKRLIDAPDS
jgi:hypothetical protein